MARKRRTNPKAWTSANQAKLNRLSDKMMSQGLRASDKRLWAALIKRREAWFHRKNPSATSIRGWVKAKAVKIVRNKAGKAVSVKIKT